MTYRITAPNNAFSGERDGIRFTDGVALTEHRPSAYFARQGYTVEQLDDPEPIEQGEPAPAAKPARRTRAKKEG